MRRLFAQRDTRLLLAGQTLSMFGDSAMFLALGIWAKTLTHSNAAAGLVFFVLAAPSLAAPLAGYVVDRVRRRPLMIAVDCGIGAALLLLLFVHDRGGLWLIYLIAGLYGASGAILGSARSALLTVMLPSDLLPDANAALQTAREGLRLLAPLAGAGLFAAFGGGTVAVLDAATFAASALALAFMHVHEPAPAQREHRFLVEVAAGARHVFRTVALRQIVLATGVALLVIGFSETLIFAVVDQGLHRSPSFLGVLEPLQGAGSIAGGLTAARMLRKLGDARLVGVGIVLFALGDLTFVSTSVAVICVGFAISGVGITWAIVGFMTAIQQRTPAHLQGRAFSAADMLLSGPQTASIAFGAALSTIVDYRILVLVMTAVTLGCGAYLGTRRIAAVKAEPAPLPEPAPVLAPETTPR